MSRRTSAVPNVGAGASDAMVAFVAVVDGGSFARGAAQLGITPSAVSKIISKLEVRLGVRLLTRTTRRIALTDAGTVFLRHVRSVLEAMETAVAQVAALEDEPFGTVRVSVGSAYAKHRLVPRLPAFHALHPKVKVELNVTDALVDPRSNTMDIAIRPGGNPASDLHATPLEETVRHLCASPAYLRKRGVPQTPEDLAHHDCLVMTSDGFDRWPFREGGRVREVEVFGPVLADNADMLLDLALADLGIVRLLDTIVGASLRRGSLVPIMSDIHVADRKRMEALVRRGREVVPHIAALIAFLKAD